MNTTRQKIRRGIIITFFLLLPITLNYYSPYLMTQGSAERIASFSLVFWAAVFVTSLVLGRAFCGWLCPFNGLQTAWERVSDKPTKMRPALRWIKFVLWAAWVAGVAAAAVAAGGWRRFDPLYMTEHGISVTEAGNLITYYLLVAITLLPALHGKRGFCHHYCPFGVWGIVGTWLGRLVRLPMLRLRADADACTKCRSCDRACPMSLPVSGMVGRADAFHAECTLCGSCVDSCKDGGVRYAFGGRRGAV
ncbi:MAG: 4Fe-4S binding protein [Actinobacteria bacterium]|nr:MAG: 4Fe-4S binding protein [Actinomycetota bacterium]